MPEPGALIGGRERREIAIAEHDPAWATRFEALRDPLREALAGVAVRVDHIGSTSVPGLAAKPIVDVQVHVWPAGGEDERRRLLFRDWLRRTPADRSRYEAVKRKLAQRSWEDMNDYAAAKTRVIEEIAARAEAWARADGWSNGCWGGSR